MTEESTGRGEAALAEQLLAACLEAPDFKGSLRAWTELQIAAKELAIRLETAVSDAMAVSKRSTQHERRAEAEAVCAGQRAALAAVKVSAAAAWQWVRRQQRADRS